jgi:lipopolysaccharide transport system ATP-binding protein
MSHVAIRVKGLGKQYRVGMRVSNTLRDMISSSFGAGGRAVRSLLGKGGPGGAGPEWFWALRDLEFDILHGEAVGFVGANGAGKSTLLKVLSRITEPTAGRGVVRGRVGSLIEVGTGFHSELTGRENVFLNGAILGMRRAEIARKFDEIVAFAEVERFIDTPIKHYSNGMQLRLGFAVAAHLDTEILIVDEVLAVGDAEFQRKCLGAMGRLVRDGRTVLFVSHNAAAVKTLCDRAIWLREGRMAGDGAPGAVIASYLSSAAGPVPERVLGPHSSSVADAPRDPFLRRLAARPAQGDLGDPITTATPFIVEVDYWNGGGDSAPTASFALFNEQETLLFESTEPSRDHLPASLQRATCHVPGALFTTGVYRLEISLVHEEGAPTGRSEELFFTILDAEDDVARPGRRRPSVIRPALHWESRALEDGQDCVASR